MKKFTRALALIMCAVMLLTAAPICAGAATTADLTYEIYYGEVEITDCSTDAAGELVIPETIEGYPVTEIRYDAFYNCDELTSIVVPASVTYIGSYAFEYCKGLKYVKLPADAAISSSVFYGVPYASKITYDTDFITIEWTEGVDETTVVIGKDVEYLNAFNNMDDIVGKVKEVQLAAGNKTFKLIDGALYDADVETLIIYPTASTKTSYTMPSTVVMVDTPYNAGLTKAESLVNITLGKNFIGGMFDEEGMTYEELIEMAIEEAGSEVEAYYMLGQSFAMLTAYVCAPNLANIYVEQGNLLLSSKDGILYDASGKILVKVPVNNAQKNITIPEYLGAMYFPTALTGCKDLSVTISDKFTENLYAILMAEAGEDLEGLTQEEINIQYAYVVMQYMSGFTANSFNVSASNKYLCSEDGVLYNKDKTILVKYPIARRNLFYEVPETVDAQLSFVDAMDHSLLGAFNPAFTTMLIDFFNFDFSDVDFAEAIAYPAQITVHLSDEQAAVMFPGVDTDSAVVMGIPNVCVETMTPEITEYNEMVDEMFAELDKELEELEKAYAAGEVTKEEYDMIIMEYNMGKSMIPRVFCCSDNHTEFEVYDNENGYITA
ncbi:MAG: leucine-rich repeat domain-containing protein, partial [Clostridia bacterium]|nr:leucine-rich repeat domain-containing protein [Clostridia bacterium]